MKSPFATDSNGCNKTVPCFEALPKTNTSLMTPAT